MHLHARRHHTTLMGKGMNSKMAFDIMENVRKAVG